MQFVPLTKELLYSAKLSRSTNFAVFEVRLLRAKIKYTPFFFAEFVSERYVIYVYISDSTDFKLNQ